MENYILMHKNEPVAIVDINDKGIHVNTIVNQNWMPFGVVEATDKTINKRITEWNGDRCIPFGRPNYEELIKHTQIKCTSDWITKSYMCSLTDCYWFKPEASNTTWKDVNFYQNGFSSNLYKHLFYGENNEPINNFNSPDLTTNGVEPKMWIEQNGNFYLLKHYFGKKPIRVCNEYVVSKLFAKLGLNCVEYELVLCDNKICCKSKCFIDSDKEEFVPATDLMKECGYTMKDVGQLMNELGFEKEFNEMIVGDYLSGNSDRHSGNFGIIVDSDTKQIKQFAPLFDHGKTYIYENMDNLDYFVGETKFGKAINNVDAKYLDIIHNIAESDVADILNSVPYMLPNTRNDIFCEFFRRVEYVDELIKEKEIEYGREY